MLTLVLMIGSCALGVIFSDKIKAAISAPLTVVKSIVAKVRSSGG